MIQDWLQRSPELPGPYTLEGWRLRQLRAYPAAQQRLQQALQIDPHYGPALVELGIVYEELNLPERSLVLYERALTRNPQQPDVAERLETLRRQHVGRPKPDSDTVIQPGPF